MFDSVLDEHDLAVLSACKIQGTHDELDFYAALRTSPTHYNFFEYHWPYVVQATRGHGYVYKNNDTRIYFHGRWSSAGSELVVVTMFGAQLLPGLDALKEYAHAHALRMRIKNIPVSDLAYWNEAGYCECPEAWSSYADKDDNSFAEYQYELSTLALAQVPLLPGERRSCRASHAQLLRKFLRERKIEVIPYEAARHKTWVYRMLHENAAFLETKNVDAARNVIDAHLFVFDEDLLHKIRLIHSEHDEIVGFNYLTVVGTTIYGNALIHKNEANLMRFLAWQGFNYLYETLAAAKSSIVSMQGSETSGQYWWKKGFGPVREIQKTHITPCAKSFL